MVITRKDSESIHVRCNKEDKIYLCNKAKDLSITVSNLLVDAAKLYGSVNPMVICNELDRSIQKKRVKQIGELAICLNEVALDLAVDLGEKYYNDSTSPYKYPIVQGVFYIINGQIVLNKAAETQLLYLKEFLENIIAEYEQGDKQAYVKNVLKLLEREDDYSEDKWVNYKTSEELHSEFVEYLSTLVGKKFDIKSESYEDLRFDFQTTFHKLVEGSNITVRKEDLWSPTGKANDKLKKYGINYRFEKVDNYIELKNETSY